MTLKELSFYISHLIERDEDLGEYQIECSCLSLNHGNRTFELKVLPIDNEEEHLKENKNDNFFVIDFTKQI